VGGGGGGGLGKGGGGGWGGGVLWGEGGCGWVGVGGGGVGGGGGGGGWMGCLGVWVEGLGGVCLGWFGGACRQKKERGQLFGPGNGEVSLLVPVLPANATAHGPSFMRWTLMSLRNNKRNLLRREWSGLGQSSVTDLCQGKGAR